MRRWCHAGVLLAAALLTGCQTTGRIDASRATPVFVAGAEVPDDQLLDVGIEVFDVSAVEQRDDGAIGEGVRKAEARFVPVHLKQTMQRTGHWGAVRVVPSASSSIDLLVRGEILRSDGEGLDLRIEAIDAAGRRWFDRTYTAEVPLAAYDQAVRGERDAFQDLYNTIANELALFKVGLTPDQLRTIREVSEMRFAGDIAPDAFQGYVTETPEGLSVLSRLPARDDPMIARVRRVRERDYMLVDAVNAHYDGYYDDLWEPYVTWRRYRAEEAATLREMERRATAAKVLGALALIGAGVAAVTDTGGSTVRNLAVLGGAVALGSGLNQSADAAIHADALYELDTSFEAEAEPMVLDVEGETVRLTGSAETQYAKWRALLKDIYLKETGLGRPEGALVPAAAPRARPPAPAPAAVGTLPPLP